MGNRPQFVKAAAVSPVLRRSSEEILLHTGQHYDDEMSRVFFEELALPRPEVELGLGSGTNTAQTARMLIALEEQLERFRPDVVLVYGDTNTTLAGALAATQRSVPVAHVEAGMRSFDRRMPEELNRVLTDHMSDLLLCSTQTAVENLAAEGLFTGVHLVGDVMADLVAQAREAAEARSDVLERHGLSTGGYLLLTAHRAGNVDTLERLSMLVALIEGIDRNVVFPVHPRTRARLREFALWDRLATLEHVLLLTPVGYLDLIKLAAHAASVLTDSGGLQKEAYVLGVPCITLRDRTEWVETVDSGWNVLVDLDVNAVRNALRRSPPAEHPPLYGDGHTAETVVAALR